jgi:hypothetical protein
VYLFSVMHKLVGGQEIIGELRDFFLAKGYEPGRIVSNADATIEDLKAIPHNCSVFFFNSHSSYRFGTDRTVPLFACLMTATPVNEETEERYAGDIRAGLVTTFSDDTEGFGERYWITEKFIRKYWRFPDNSLVFLHACMSFNEPLNTILLSPVTSDEETTGCGAGVFCGWSWGATGDLAPRYLFDRLLGANLIREETRREDPPQRPFDIDAVWEDMAVPGRNLIDDYDAHTKHATKLEYGRRPGCTLGLLAPSIEHATFDEQEKIVTLTGAFGTGTPKVRVFVKETPGGFISEGDTELIAGPGDSPQELTCMGMPERGRGSAGYLVAAADYGSGSLVMSNAVPVTSWRGTFTFTLRLPDQDADSPGIGQVTTPVFLRGDIHRPRKKPGVAPYPRPCTFCTVLDPETTGQYTSGGDYTSQKNGYSCHWHGSGSMPHDGEQVIGVWGWHRFPMGPLQPKLFVDILTRENQVLVDIRDEKGKLIGENLVFPVNVLYLANEVNRLPFIFDFLNGSLTWAEADGKYERSYDIPGNCIEAPVYCGDFPDAEKIVIGRLRWETLKAEFIPDKDTES